MFFTGITVGIRVADLELRIITKSWERPSSILVQHSVFVFLGKTHKTSRSYQILVSLFTGEAPLTKLQKCLLGVYTTNGISYNHLKNHRKVCH